LRNRGQGSVVSIRGPWPESVVDSFSELAAESLRWWLKYEFSLRCWRVMGCKREDGIFGVE
jgi:hypothetical protein